MNEAPPLSAFLDYIYILWRKTTTNSVTAFYKVIFMKTHLKKIDEENNLHNTEKDSIKCTEFKKLYEKFCYLNEYTEKSLSDSDNIRKLLKYGFVLKE